MKERESKTKWPGEFALLPKRDNKATPQKEVENTFPNNALDFLGLEVTLEALHKDGLDGLAYKEKRDELTARELSFFRAGGGTQRDEDISNIYRVTNQIPPYEQNCFVHSSTAQFLNFTTRYGKMSDKELAENSAFMTEYNLQTRIMYALQHPGRETVSEKKIYH